MINGDGITITTDEFAEIAEIKISLHKNGNVTIGGAIGNLGPALALLDHAKDCVRRYHSKLAHGDIVTIPEYDTSIPRAKHYSLNMETAKLSLAGANLH